MRLRALFLLSMPWLGGCATTKPAAVAPQPSSQSPSPSVRELLDPPPDLILQVQESGTKIELVASSDQALANAIRSSQVIYLGERHDDARAHRFEEDMLERVLETSWGGASREVVEVGFEMLPVSAQPSLDAYLGGKLTEAAFLAAVDWEHTWGFPFLLYRPLLERCRERGIRGHALNAPAGLAKKIAKGGVAALTDEEKGRLPIMRPEEEQFRHFATTMRALPAHGPLSDEALGRYYQAQLLWDETMAETIANARHAPGAPRKMVVIAGEEHARRFAVPSRVERRGVKSDLVVLPVYASEIEGSIAEVAGSADFLYVLRGAPMAEPAPPPSPARR